MPEQWWENPRVKAWVTSLVENKDAIGRSIKAPLREMLGCGHWGCVFDSRGPWVVKLTIDPNEAPIWEKIIRLIDEERYGQGGMVRVKGLYRLEPGVMYGGRMKRVYAIVREAVEPVFSDVRGSSVVELTKATKKKLSIKQSQRTFLRHTYQSYEIVTDYGPLSSPRIEDFITNISALTKYRVAAQELRYGQWPNRQHTKDRLERIAYQLSGPYGGALGETLTMLLARNVILQDVHLFNIGWRKHRSIKGFGEEDTTMVIFDPGHTPAGRGIDIPVVRVQNPWGGWS
jgi:hypothetical protein